MSPVITLLVGPEEVRFHACEDAICRLPFFHAALKGSFREASTKTISLPEDAPHIVAALIEFLYVGSYTYTFPAPLSQDQEAPARSLTEGIFHASVFELASKYDCGDLAEEAVRGVAYVVGGMDGMDVVRLLKEVYERGMELYGVREEKEMEELVGRMPGLLKGLYVIEKEEMRTIMVECPELGSDLLRALACRV